MQGAADPQPAVEPMHRVPLLSLLLAFLRLGLTAFGGPAMVEYIRELAVREKRWLSQESLADGTEIYAKTQIGRRGDWRRQGVVEEEEEGAQPCDHSFRKAECPASTTFSESARRTCHARIRPASSGTRGRRSSDANLT